MTAPDLLTRCRAVLARMHHAHVIPGHSVDDDVLAELEGRWLAFREPFGRTSNVYATPHAASFCADPSTFQLDPEPDPYSQAEIEREAVAADLGCPSACAPTLDAGWPHGADRGVRS